MYHNSTDFEDMLMDTCLHPLMRSGALFRTPLDLWFTTSDCGATPHQARALPAILGTNHRHHNTSTRGKLVDKTPEANLAQYFLTLVIPIMCSWWGLM